MDIPTLLAFLCLTKDQKYEVRWHVVERVVRKREKVEQLARLFPFTARTIYRWVARFACGGKWNLKDRKPSGRPRKWTAEHAEWICRLVVDSNPRQYKFEFALWTSARIRIAFYDKFGVGLSDWTVRRILKTLGLTPQKPKRRARKYSARRVRQWKTEGFPRISQQAKELGATILFADESGLDSHSVKGQTWGKKGKTPVVRVADSRFRLNMLAAISPDGRIYHRVQEGRAGAETDGKIIVAVDHCSIHAAKRTKEWMAGNRQDIEIRYQPTHAPAVNPVELLWALTKRQVSRQLSKTKAEMRTNLNAALESLKESPEKVQAFFREKDCQYIRG